MLEAAAHATREVRQEGVPVEASWPQRFHDLNPEFQLVLRAWGILDYSSLSQVAAAAVLEQSLSRAEDAFLDMVGAGWGQVVDDHLDIAPEAWPFLERLARLTPESDARIVIENIAAAVERAMAGTVPLSPGVRTDVLSVLRAANQYDMPDTAARAARAAWDTVVPGATRPDVIDPGADLAWWRAVAEEGEKAAGRSRQPQLLAELLDLSAQFYSAVDDWQGAETAWVRALYLMDKLGDDSEYDRYLELLAANYQDAGQATALATTLVELVERYERSEEPEKAISALSRLGTTMLGSGRLDTAIVYLDRAERLLAALPETNDLRIRRAVILSDLGQAHARRLAINAARIFYHEALTLVIDLDKTVTQRIRDLQAALPESPS